MTKLSPKQVLIYWESILNNRLATDAQLQEANFMAASHSTNPAVIHCTDYRKCPRRLNDLSAKFSREVNMLLTGPKHRRHVFRYDAKEVLEEIKNYKN